MTESKKVWKKTNMVFLLDFQNKYSLYKLIDKLCAELRISEYLVAKVVKSFLNALTQELHE